MAVLRLATLPSRGCSLHYCCRALFALGQLPLSSLLLSPVVEETEYARVPVASHVVSNYAGSLDEGNLAGGTIN